MSPAYAAGLRDGMRLVKQAGGEAGDSSVELIHRVKDGETERRFHYLPRRRRSFVTQRIALVDTASAVLARLKQRLAGN